MSIITTKLIGKGRTETIYHETNRKLTTDANKENGGMGENPNPVMVLCSALAACAMTVISMAATKMNVDAEGCYAEVTNMEEDHDNYCVTKISLTIHLKASFDQSVRKRLEAYAHRACYVGNTLKAEKDFTFVYE